MVLRTFLIPKDRKNEMRRRIAR